jgi:hypothetical protein
MPVKNWRAERSSAERKYQTAITQWAPNALCKKRRFGTQIMNERIVLWAWRTSVLSLIATTGCGAVALGYCGIMSLLGHHWQPGAGMSVAAASLGAAAWALIRNRDDLVGG